MPYTIQLAKSLRTFTINDGETILAAAQRNKIVLPYSCRNGACSSCKAKILEGEVTQQKQCLQNALSEKEIKDNIVLLCCTEAKSHLKIDAHELICLDDQEIKKMSGTISNIKRITEDIIILELELQKNITFNFHPGQYIELLLPKGIRRAYSIANLVTNGIIELHIRHLSGGLFTDWLFESGKIGNLLRFEGPLGTFFLRKKSKKPIIFLASGTGFAPIKAIIEDEIRYNSSRNMTLYWSGRTEKDLYMQKLALSWVKKLPNFKFVPVLFDISLNSSWTGKRGLLHQAVIEDFLDLVNYDVYASGSPTMVKLAHQAFVANSLLPSQAFFSDAFTSMATKGESF